MFGKVVDENGQPIELATVQVKSQNVLTLTTLRGDYSLHYQSLDSVAIVYSMIGYETRRRLLRSPGDSVRLDITLPSLGARMVHSVVTCQHIQTGTTQRIKPTDTHLMPSTTGNGVEEIIATQGGVSTYNEFSS